MSKKILGRGNIDPDLVEAVCLAHDVGHAPFGHAGERALNELMDNYGGFEGNAQTLRVLTETIWRGSSPGERLGMNPTRALLDGVLKYKKTRSVVRSTNHFIYNEQQKYIDFVHAGSSRKDREALSIECQIMNWADDVAYSVYDFLDAVYARFITMDKLTTWQSKKRHAPLIEELIERLRNREIAKFAAHKIGEFIESCQLIKTANKTVAARTNRYRYELKVPDNKRAEQECLKEIAKDLVFASPAVQQLEYKAQAMIKQLFQVLSETYVRAKPIRRHLLNEDVEKMFEKTKRVGDRARLLCDYVSGMSDDYVIRTCRRLFDPEFGSIVDLV